MRERKKKKIKEVFIEGEGTFGRRIVFVTKDGKKYIQRFCRPISGVGKIILEELTNE